jgi:short-subunit dehydrogenase
LADDFAERYGPWAVVTGAAQGLGEEYATTLAARGVSVLGVDVRPSPAAAQSLVADLASDDGVAAVLGACGALEIGLLVANAALSLEGPFLSHPLDGLLTQLDVNCRAPLRLVHGLLPAMVTRGRGGVILMSSLSAMRGSPMVAGYAATKAWNLILAESLWDEMRDTGVDVMAVLPGSTRTPGWVASKPQDSLGTANVMEAAAVVAEVLEALGTGPSFVPGATNRDSEQFMATLERPAAVRLMGDVMRAMYPT